VATLTAAPAFCGVSRTADSTVGLSSAIRT
jgi:hypothetical protein